MKVVMINSVSGYGSTGSICVDIALELERQGHECFIAYGQVSRGYQNEFKIGTKLENHLHNVGSRLFGKQGYFTKRGTKKLVDFLRSYNPDVIHLHNLHGNYLNLEILFKYLIEVQKPVVWTLHDCWAFTGKCAHYTDVNCYKWETQCKQCPQLASYPPSLFFDYSKEMFNDKKKWLIGLQNLQVITVSHWLNQEASRSFLKKYPISTIYNWVEHSIFKESRNDDFIKKYSIDCSKFTIILVSASWHAQDVKWQDALKLAQIIDSDSQIILVGNVASPNLVPKNCIHIDYLHGNEELAIAYSVADVYVHLSTEDTFGKVIAEAMSCGTPAIVYDATACPELVDEGCGYVVEKRNIEQVNASLLKVKAHTKKFYSQSCVDKVTQDFDLKTNVENTILHYKKGMSYGN
ncbi:hypothetical protein BXU11_04905 [Flavobacterium sp. LM5]|uniref:glycosyltransferase n=1 Tax=Flavobacterium sp. LM5 TaxID=1938610 RepID=UPI00099344EC|nr:glycosyltransferase [Flavobacterium sp. LM5]OOV29261.1 hypothetical protein BXU11_04905 [Flavobacterium sp. LM5]